MKPRHAEPAIKVPAGLLLLVPANSGRLASAAQKFAPRGLPRVHGAHALPFSILIEPYMRLAWE